MALDHMSNTSPPRLSFSHNLPLTQTQTQTPLLDDPNNPDFEFEFATFDFDFCIPQDKDNSGQLVSSADELFSQGLILPLPLQLHQVSISKKENTNQHNSSSKATAIPAPDADADGDEPNSKSSFWRSSSVHVDKKKSSYWSSLPRSNSTGSVAPSPKQLQDSNNSQSRLSNPKGTSSFHMYTKPPLKRNYGNGVHRINPVLNVSPPFISKGTASFFGFASLFGNGSKDKKNKK